ncbi:MAG: MurR/RpiR family transcriptional regulator [Spirochaetaceae bacterium]|jgi:DNA-binding MurR/RpiR family transcriptional regulator|nr:MurR/RpiR family transcriptional regulator [Spirochaetaceae bacterium]
MDGKSREQGIFPQTRFRVNALSASEKRVMEFVSTHQGDVINMSMIEIARAVGVSDATVLRFVRSVGFDGFNSFKISVAAELMHPKDAIFESVKPDDTYEVIVQKVIGSNIQVLRDTLYTLDTAKLQEVIGEIKKARRIFCCAVGTSAHMAQWFYDRLFRLEYPVTAIVDLIHMYTQASITKNDELFLFISRSGYPVTLVKIMRILRKQHPGVKQILITCDASSPMAKLSDINLIGVSREKDPDIAGSAVSISSIIDIIYTCLELTAIGRTFENQQRIWEASNFFNNRPAKTPKDGNV